MIQFSVLDSYHTRWELQMRIRGAVSVVVGALLAVVAATASALPVTEIGDAGQTIASAQVVPGSGPVDSISGTFTSASDVDLFKIHIATPGLFSATASSVPALDGLLFLFDSAGKGVVSRDDSSNSNGDFGALTSTFVVLAGDYFLGISLFDNIPSSAGGLIFPDTRLVDSGIEYGPSGPGGAQALSTWSAGGGGLTGSAGSYTIALRGVSGVSGVPEPATLALLALGLGGLGFSRHRKSN